MMQRRRRALPRRFPVRRVETGQLEVLRIFIFLRVDRDLHIPAKLSGKYRLRIHPVRQLDGMAGGWCAARHQTDLPG